MAEFIGSRISLISKRDIRYVGTLHEISSENSTVALEQVSSFGTEGRRPDDEVPPSDNVYEYIVFRGSDVKDLRIEEGPKEPPAPQVPDDPAILGSARVPAAASKSHTPQAQASLTHDVSQSRSQAPMNQAPPSQAPPNFQQQPPFPYGYPPPPNQRFGPQGYPPGPNYQGVPYGAPPPGWYPPPGYGFPAGQPGRFPPHMPEGAPNQHFLQDSRGVAGPHPVEANTNSKMDTVPEASKEVAKVRLPILPTSSTHPAQRDGPTPPVASKPAVEEALAPPVAKGVPSGPKNGRIVPAVPLSSNPKATNGFKSVAGNMASYGAPSSEQANAPKPVTAKSIEEANRDARAAVAQAMAKLPKQAGQTGPIKPSDTGVMDSLTRKVGEVRLNDGHRGARQPGTGEYVAHPRGHHRGRGGPRGGRIPNDQQTRKIEVPQTDYDFATANAKFNKQDLVKEAIASGSPAGTPIEGSVANGGSDHDTNSSRKDGESAVPPIVSYNKNSSFFDNISSEIKDRSSEGGPKLGGREFRSEERQKNLETFGQGSVDNNHRGGFRGRGRGRGYGRGGRGGSRGGRGGLPAGPLQA